MGYLRLHRRSRVEPGTIAQHGGDSLRRLAVPALDRGWRVATPSPDLACRLAEPVAPGDESVRPLDAGDRSLGVGTHGEARNAEEGRFLLQSAGIRDHQIASHHE